MHVYHFQFDQHIPTKELKDTLILAVMATESLHSRARVKLDAVHNLNLLNHTCRIDAFSEVGDDLARIFTGYALREYGNERINIERDFLDIPAGSPTIEALREAIS